MTFRLLNFTMTQGLSDPNSAEFIALQGKFCAYVSIHASALSKLHKSSAIKLL